MHLVRDAREFAYTKHFRQKRKYTGDPYFVHLSEVAALTHAAGGDDIMVAAAWLHDVVEDTDATHQDVEGIFGPDVATLVYYLTDVSKPEDGNRAVRKAKDREHIAKGPGDAHTIKLADMISNSVNIQRYDPDFARVYMREKDLLMPCLKRGDRWLFDRACRILSDYQTKELLK